MTFAALLLAGGESRRMGRDKATLKFGGEPLWQRQLRTLRALGPDQVVVSARVTPAWLPVDVELLLDDSPSRGPLSGLAKALAQMRTTHLVALAVDMPFMTTGELKRLLEMTTDVCGIVPTIGDRVEPLAAIYPASAVEGFAAAPAGLDFSLQTVIRKLAAAAKVRLLPVGDESIHLYQSVNEPADLQL